MKRKVTRCFFWWTATMLMVGLTLAAPASAAVGYATAGSTYSQDFDTLPISGTSNPWTNDVTLPGWFALEDDGSDFNPGFRNNAPYLATTIIRAGDGMFTTSRLWSLGNTGSSERALGLIESGLDREIALVLENNTGETLSQFTLTYDGELWNSAGGAAEILDFDYATFASEPTLADLAADNVAPYTNPGGWGGLLDFTTPATASGALDGNLPENRVAGITGTVDVNWSPGEYLVLRWWDDDRGNPTPIDHKLAIDNLTFSAVVPEPGTLGLLLIGLVGLVRRR